MRYLYEYTDSEGGEVEVNHSMAQDALTTYLGRPVRRLISGSSEPVQFRYRADDTSAWSAHGHAKPEGHRAAEKMLGRKLYRPKDG